MRSYLIYGKTVVKQALSRSLCLFLVLVAGTYLLPATAARATAVYGKDDGSQFLIRPTSETGYTAYTSIDDAVAAGVTAGRTVMEFEGDWSGISIDETINLRNDDLTFQGDVSMTWASGVDAFGDRNGLDFQATINNLAVTTTGSSARGVEWYQNVHASRAGTLTLSNVTFTTTGDAVFMSGITPPGNGYACKGVCTVMDSSLTSSGGNGINVYIGRHRYNGSDVNSSVTVDDSRVTANGNGIMLRTLEAAQLNSLKVRRCEVISTATDSSGDLGINVHHNNEASPLIVVDSLVQGFGIGILENNRHYYNDTDWHIASYWLNNTIVGTGDSTGIKISIGSAMGFKWDKQDSILMNNILAGHSAGLRVEEAADNFSIRIRGNNNAFFANTNDVSTSGSVTIGDSGRVTPAYAMADAFVDPDNATLASRDYRLVVDASALIDAGEQFQGDLFSSGTTQTWVDFNYNSSYAAGTDYIIDLAGYTGDTSGHNLLLYDANVDGSSDRLYGDTVDIGAYEYSPGPPQGTVVVIQ